MIENTLLQYQSACNGFEHSHVKALLPAFSCLMRAADYGSSTGHGSDDCLFHLVWSIRVYVCSKGVLLAELVWESGPSQFLGDIENWWVLQGRRRSERNER